MALLLAPGMQAQAPADSAKIYFRIGHRQFDPTLGDNAAQMERFAELVRKAAEADDIHRIVVRAYASPDGQNEANNRLTGFRCQEITGQIIKRTAIDPSLVKAIPEGIAWEELLTLVETAPGVPDRERVAEVIRNTPVWIYDDNGKIIDGRKHRLMQISGGDTYRWMFDNLFPQLRNAVAVSLFLKSDIRAAIESAASAAREAATASEAAANAARSAAVASDKASDAAREYAEAVKAAEEAAARAARAADDAGKAADRAREAADEAVAAADAAASAEEVEIAKAKAAEAFAAKDAAEASRDAAQASLAEAEEARAAAEEIAAKAAAEAAEAEADQPAATEARAGADLPAEHRFALKTNLLYYPILMPNVELEWLIKPKWSVALEANVAWWKNDPKHKYYQILMISPEVRYHINPKASWHGMYVGLFTGGGKYDLENGKNGYRGEGAFVGASFGYMWPVSRCISLEAGIGLGYLYTRHKEYAPFDGHYLYQRTKTLNYFGPLKLKFSFVWRFYDTNRHR